MSRATMGRNIASVASSKSVDFTLSDTSISSKSGSNKRFAGSKREGSCCSRHCAVIKKAPSVIWIPFIIFGLLCGGGIAVILTAANSDRVIEEKDAVSHAQETGRWFSSQFDKATAPVFSLAQFMSEIEEFRNLPDAVGAAHAKGSLPFLPEPTQDNIPTYRDFSGSPLEDPKVQERFARISATIKDQANLPGVLVALVAVPHGVVSLIYPHNNTEDFDGDAYLDNTGVLGLDLLTHPVRRASTEATIRSKDMVVLGPVELHQCADREIECDPIVTKAFVPRLTIPSKTHNITLPSDQSVYNTWGFAAGILNWNALVEQSELYKSFAEKEREFYLSKIQVRCGAAGAAEACTNHEVELAETPGFARMGRGWRTVTISMDTTIEEWRMTVGYQDPASWLPYAITAVVIASLSIGLLVYYILFQRQIQAAMAEEKSVIQRKIRSLERKKAEMEKMLKNAQDQIQERQQAKSKVGLVSNMRKIGRLEEEMRDVDKDIEGLEQYVHDLSSKRSSKSTPATVVVPWGATSTTSLYNDSDATTAPPSSLVDV